MKVSASILGSLVMLASTSTIAGGVSIKPFGKLDDGRVITQYQLQNNRGTRVNIIDLGAIIASLYTLDNKGNSADIVLGFDNPQQYLRDSPYFGAIVGRYANRIARGRFTLEGKEYKLATNNGENHLHGGFSGFDKRLWQAEVRGKNSLALHLTSADGDQGYPGELRLAVTYTLDDKNRLTVDYQATTDKTTIFNPSQHSYFNLAGHSQGDILQHQLQLNADKYTPVDSGLIPTGKLAEVAGTAFDFTEAKAIGKHIGEEDTQLAYGQGYDHNWVLSADTGLHAKPAAIVAEPKSGRSLTIYTDQPGIQFYSGNFLDGSIRGKQQAIYGHRNGFCLETQHFPDSPNQGHFPSTLLKAGDLYQSRTVFEFGTVDARGDG